MGGWSIRSCVVCCRREPLRISVSDEEGAPLGFPLLCFKMDNDFDETQAF
jgi:hypothetical protein